MAAYRWVYDSHHLRLTAQNRDQLRNPTLGNGVWAAFTFYLYLICRLMRVIMTFVWCLVVGGSEAMGGRRCRRRQRATRT